MTSKIPSLPEDLRDAAESLARDPHRPLAHRLAARALLSAASAEKQQAAIAVFDAYTTELEGELVALLKSVARPEPVEPMVGGKVPGGKGKTPAIFGINRSTKFGAIVDEYKAMFAQMQPLPAQVATIAAVRRRIIIGRAVYVSVEAVTGVPWYFIANVHGLESGFDFSRHLHNGDPLTNRTVRVPKGRPAVGTPPFAWGESAADALRGHALEKVTMWSLERILFEMERFNGFGYRLRGLPTPYLWSGSDQYRAGKFVRDGVFDPTAVSRQIGGAVIIQAMIAAGDIVQPAPETSAE